MYLKSLTIKGFKSFAHSTTFQLEPGVTCIVGPNGSGKSNVVDALAWVMGEQGAKTLRGGKMEDVIFAGTATASPLGRAQVSLTIDNSDGALPIEYSEVQISRTLFRNGGSEYAINGDTVRLLDVQELLSDSGLGREMHVIVGQGQLDRILQATPEERRGFVEEAAGILKHRRRKEKTLRKLDAMESNLTRLGDLAGELRRQLKPLGAQAEIAREAASIQAIVRESRTKLIAHEVIGLRAQLSDAGKDESARRSERLVLQEQLDRATLRAERLEAAMLRDDVDAARRVANDLEREHAKLLALQALAQQRIALLTEDEALPDLVRIDPAQVEHARAEAETLAAGIADAEAALGTSAAQTALARASLDALDEEIARQSALVSKHDLEAAARRASVDVAQTALAARAAELDRRTSALDQARTRLDDAEAAVDALGPDHDDDGDQFAADYRSADARVAEHAAARDAARDVLHGLERERDALAARTAALAGALERKNAGGDVLAAGTKGILGRVGDRVKVHAGYERAIAAALGSASEGLLADSRDAAVHAVEQVRDGKLGRVEIVVGDARPASVALGALPKGAVHAPTVVDAPEGVLGLLAHIVIVDDLAIAAALSNTLTDPAAGPVTVVTREGDVMTEYLVRGGERDTQSSLELRAEHDEAAASLTRVSTEIERASAAFSDARAAYDTAQRDAAAALTALRAHDAERAERGETRSRTIAGRDAARADVERAESALQDAVRGRDAAASDADAAERAAEEFARTPRPILDASARDELVSELDAARAAETEARVQVETARERVRAERARADQLAREAEAQRERAEAHARRAVQRKAQADRARRVDAAVPAVLAAAERSVTEARARLAEAEADRAERSRELATLRADESGLRERLHAVTERVHGLEMETYERKLHLSALLERAAGELGLDEDVLVGEFAPGDDFDRQAVQHELARAERKLRDLGRINPLALEEFAALEQRYQFLTEQIADVTQSRKDLEQIIGELDERMRDIFVSAFDDTKAAFAEVFPILFPGGSGQLTLTNPDDPLTTGVEVTVRPAGKRIDRISLLSGGERSLAAVAMMVAIFIARPSPFYIMDEVEAALDDANLGRLLTLFEQLREHSQLIIITHQKRTMEIADALYGVSMRQDGVSAVVGQRVGRTDAS